MVIRMSPSATANPAISASALPKLRRKRTTLISGIRETVEDGGRTVPGPVVDEDHLGPLGEVPQHGYQLVGERTDIVALVEHGHDDRNHLIRLGHS